MEFEGVELAELERLAERELESLEVPDTVDVADTEPVMLLDCVCELELVTVVDGDAVGLVSVLPDTTLDWEFERLDDAVLDPEPEGVAVLVADADPVRLLDGD